MKSKIKFYGISLLLLTAVASLFVFPLPDKPSSPEVKEPKKEIVREVPDNNSGYIPGIDLEPVLTSDSKKPLKVLELTDENTVEFIGEVNDASMDKLISDINSAQAKTARIYLVIDSPGGSVFAGARAMQAIQGSRVPVYTICVGICASMGAQLHALGVKRYMTTQAVLMYHPASGGLQGDFNIMSSRLVFLTKYFAKMDLYIANRAGIPYEEFQRRLRSEYWLDAQDATFERFNDNVVILDDVRSPKILLFGLPIPSIQEGDESSSDKFFKFK